MLLNEKELRERVDTAYRHLKARAKPRLYKNGRKAGKIRVPGIDKLPFTKGQLWQHALFQVGDGVRQCPYCVAIGRPANLITLANFVFDHKVPEARGGGHTLDNLFSVCADCNNCKGKLSYEFFVMIMNAAERGNEHDRKAFHMCLRSHGVSGRMRGFFGKPKTKPEPVEMPTSRLLPLDDDF